MALPAILGACLTTTPVETPPRRFVPTELQPGDGVSIISAGAQDIRNRFLSTVMLMTPGLGRCSGVLIDPRLVLTAGHCVCPRRKPVPPENLDNTVVDRSTCVQSTTVIFSKYREGDPASADEQLRIGRVNPHEQLKILYDARGREVLSNADLAVLVLDTALVDARPVQLTEKQALTNEPVILVGYGQENPTLADDGRRRVGMNEVASIEQHGATFLVGKPITIRNPYAAKEPLLVREDASYALAGDSGGPCLREKGGTFELIGIAKTAYGTDRLVDFSEYTSTYAFRDWLRQEIMKAHQDDHD